MTGIIQGHPQYSEKTKREILASSEEAEKHLSAGGLSLLEKYSNIPKEDIVPHILNIQKRAFAICPYPCIAHLRFLNLNLRQHTCYLSIINRLKQGQAFLDIGCCFGQDIRALAHDGAPVHEVLGVDIEPRFLQLGYDLFLDSDKIFSKFLAVNILNDDEPLWAKLKGTQDLIHTANFFHLWNLHTQYHVFKMVVGLLRPVAGSMIVGSSIGAVEARDVYFVNGHESMYCHSPQSLQNVWKQLGAEMGIKFVVEVVLMDLDKDVRFEPFLDRNFQRVLFTISGVDT